MLSDAVLELPVPTITLQDNAAVFCFDHFLIYRRLKTIWWLIRRTARTDQPLAFLVHLELTRSLTTWSSNVGGKRMIICIDLRGIHFSSFQMLPDFSVIPVTVSSDSGNWGVLEKCIPDSSVL